MCFQFLFDCLNNEANNKPCYVSSLVVIHRLELLATNEENSETMVKNTQFLNTLGEMLAAGTGRGPLSVLTLTTISYTTKTSYDILTFAELYNLYSHSKSRLAVSEPWDWKSKGSVFLKIRVNAKKDIQFSFFF